MVDPSAFERLPKVQPKQVLIRSWKRTGEGWTNIFRHCWLGPVGEFRGGGDVSLCNLQGMVVLRRSL